jgi:undecaprenyl-diphosphatase
MAYVTSYPATLDHQAPVPRVSRPSTLMLGLGSTALFLVLLIDALINPRAFFDLDLMQAVQRVDLAGSPQVMSWINELTGSEGAVVAWAITLIVLSLARWWIAAAATATLPIGGVINYVVGEMFVPRTRPHLAELERSSSNFGERSFPSGHVMGAIMLYGFLFVVARKIRFAPLRWSVQGGSLIVIATVGISRVWSGAHWPTDVLAAYALGGALLAALLALYTRVDRAIGHLPLIHAGAVPHDEARPHIHALTSLVRFHGDTVSKTYQPGLIPTVLYWLTFQAQFPYIRNMAALEAAVARRNLARLLTTYWYGSPRVARAYGAYRVGDHVDLISERVVGTEPTDKVAAKAFLRDLRGRFEASGLPTWQIDPRQPRAIDNLLQAEDGSYHVVDLESGLVSPLASLRTWARAIRRGMVPFFDDIFFDVTRSYVARESTSIRSRLGSAGLAELEQAVAVAERTAATWHASEPRLWSKLAIGLMTGFGVRTWRSRSRARLAGSREKSLAWIDRAITAWETDGRIAADEAATLRQQVEAPTFQAMLPYLGAHILVSIPLRFPLGSIARSLMVLGALGAATGKLLTRRSSREEFGIAWSIHSPLVLILAAVPGFGSFAYLAAKPVRANRLLLRALTDAALAKAPWDLYERSKIRRFIARPLPQPAPVAVVTTLRPVTPQPIERPAWWIEEAAVGAD